MMVTGSDSPVFISTNELFYPIFSSCTVEGGKCMRSLGAVWLLAVINPPQLYTFLLLSFALQYCLKVPARKWIPLHKMFQTYRSLTSLCQPL